MRLRNYAHESVNKISQLVEVTLRFWVLQLVYLSRFASLSLRKVKLCIHRCIYIYIYIWIEIQLCHTSKRELVARHFNAISSQRFISNQACICSICVWSLMRHVTCSWIWDIGVNWHSFTRQAVRIIKQFLHV